MTFYTSVLLPGANIIQPTARLTKLGGPESTRVEHLSGQAPDLSRKYESMLWKTFPGQTVQLILLHREWRRKKKFYSCHTRGKLEKPKEKAFLWTRPSPSLPSPRTLPLWTARRGMIEDSFLSLQGKWKSPIGSSFGVSVSFSQYPLIFYPLQNLIKSSEDCNLIPQ